MAGAGRRQLLLVLLLVTALDGQQQTGTDGGEDDTWWWRTTPFSSLPGMTSRQVLRSILPPDVIPYTPVSGPEAGYVRDSVSAFKVQSRGMEHLHTYVNMFLNFITPRHLVPPGKSLPRVSSSSPSPFISLNSWVPLSLNMSSSSQFANQFVSMSSVGFFIVRSTRCSAVVECVRKRRRILNRSESLSSCLGVCCRVGRNWLREWKMNLYHPPPPFPWHWHPK